jgi:hypothetical protein
MGGWPMSLAWDRKEKEEWYSVTMTGYDSLEYSLTMNNTWSLDMIKIRSLSEQPNRLNWKKSEWNHSTV